MASPSSHSQCQPSAALYDLIIPSNHYFLGDIYTLPYIATSETQALWALKKFYLSDADLDHC